MLAEIIQQKKDEIAVLCRKHRVRALWVFGSATTDAWDPETSDIDFLVDLGDYDPEVVTRYLDFAEGLESLFGRAVDLVTTGGLRNNQRLREELERTRVLLYERDRAEAIA